jgi:uncharacterized protein YuzE
MTGRSLQVTYRKGRAFAAYLYLAHATGEKSARTQASLDGLLVVDYAADGRALGVEITSPDAVTLDRLNALLAELGQAPLAEQEFRPLTAA